MKNIIVREKKKAVSNYHTVFELRRLTFNQHVNISALPIMVS